MNSVVKSSTNFVDTATKSGFFEVVDNNVHEACMLLAKKVTPRASKNRHMRNCLRIKRYWNTYKKEIQRENVNIIYLLILSTVL